VDSIPRSFFEIISSLNEEKYMKKKIRITFNAPVVLGMVAICVIALIVNYITLGISNKLLFPL